jgi:hypothetical protein
MFEVPTEVLKRDTGSILANLPKAAAAAAADPAAIAVSEEEGVFLLERDWWLFRYILAFLRDGSLPNETSLLVALYREAGAYQCVQLQYAIEERKLHLREPEAGADKKEGPAEPALKKESKDKPAWWRGLPSWYKSVDEVVEQSKKAEAASVAAKEGDWWIGTSYKGKNFTKL